MFLHATPVHVVVVCPSGARLWAGMGLAYDSLIEKHLGRTRSLSGTESSTQGMGTEEALLSP